jgi:hypothetical protein
MQRVEAKTRSDKLESSGERPCPERSRSGGKRVKERKGDARN